MPDLLRFCVKVAQDEVNGMADFKVDIKPIRKGGKIRGTVTGFRVSWWRKNEDELKEAYQEITARRSGGCEAARKCRYARAGNPAFHLFPPGPPNILARRAFHRRILLIALFGLSTLSAGLALSERR